MDFEIQIIYPKEGKPYGDIVHFPTYQHVMLYIDRMLAQWNNFYNEEPINILIKKVPSETSTLSVKVDEGIDTRDVYGGKPKGMSEEEYVSANPPN